MRVTRLVQDWPKSLSREENKELCDDVGSSSQNLSKNALKLLIELSQCRLERLTDALRSPIILIDGLTSRS